MKKFILELKRDRLVYLFVLVGLVLIIIPQYVQAAVPYILGPVAIIYSVVTIIVCIKYPDSEADLGEAIIRGIIGIVILFMRADSIGMIGVIWAMQSLSEVAEEIEEARKTKSISVFNIVAMVITIVLAVMLMMNPNEHFTLHVRILGIEIILSAFIRRRRKRSSV